MNFIVEMKFVPCEVGAQWLYAVNSQRTNLSGMRLLILNSNILEKVKENKQSPIVMVFLVFPRKCHRFLVVMTGKFTDPTL
jgi:hypothetical protein